ncbi:MAG TPA: 50S ribosomal protein L29 [Saprospiraceae bacterium]|jgi:large subunit ribosomal protein L29|nr:50S ribosomal protein L29 [Saprospiraceae bacterium]HRO08313.1 50S ribosomal protein L29 [Saprospiraceae bacterium]HRP41738.1 50S ribosomal protein L29 [Saprospiraceae bacterium]
MASKRYLELQSLSAETLKEELTQAKSNLVQLKFDHNSKGLQDPNELRDLKKEVARLATEIRSREIKDMSAEQLAKRSKIRLRRK